MIDCCNEKNSTCCDSANENTCGCYQDETACCESAEDTSEKSCCCMSKPSAVETSTKLTYKDHLGSFQVRMGINRMNYKVKHGLYYVGRPDDKAPVLVTANYKLSFDALRKELSGISAWILVLDTKGINVWCAAGKGTFGTEELLHQIQNTGLSDLVSHRTLVLPQLGASGVSAHEIRKRSGYRVVYGPVRAQDISAFLDRGMQATEEMRRVRFRLGDRAVLTPVEVTTAVKPSLLLFGILFLLNLTGLFQFTGADVIAYTVAVLSGCVLVPLFLPWIPGRAFSLKGCLLGLLWSVFFVTFNGYFDHMGASVFIGIGYLMILPSVSAYYAMNFTGCSTFTSPSGVMKEMKRSIPFIAVALVLGIILLSVGSIITASI